MPRSFGLLAALLACALSVRATDYLLVGGGTAGLVLANRLTEDPSVSVLVLEAGGDGLGNTDISDLARIGQAWGTEVDWNFPVEPLVHAGGRSLGTVPRGKVLGGSSAINGAFYIRGDARDYDEWETLGNSGWNAGSLLTEGFKNEHFYAPEPSQNIKFNTSAHGLQGLLATSYQGVAPSIHDTIIDTVGAAGGHVSSDVSGGDIMGISHVTHARLPSNATRATSATAYYFPYSFRNNLQVELFANVDRVLWNSTGDNAVAAGVQYTDKDGNLQVANATTVILAAGTWGSPPILERSGVGNKTILSSLGVETVIDLPYVGENMQEQPAAILTFNLNASLPLDAFQPLLINFESIQTVVGDGGNSGLDSLFVKPANMPDALFTWYQNLHKSGTPWVEEASSVSTSGSANTVLTWYAMNLRPLSLGSCHISTTDHTVLPKVDYNWFDSEFDTLLLALAVQRLMKLASSPPLSNFVTSNLAPGPNVTSIDALKDWVRSAAVGVNHPVGSAFMGPREVGGVVDTNLKVYGTSNLFVVDASVIPVEPAGHTQATVYAIAERAAELFQKE